MSLFGDPIELSAEGKAIVSEANRVFMAKLFRLAAVFGIVNVAALVGVYIAAQKAAKVAVTARVEGPVAVVNEMLSATMISLGNVREEVGGLQSQSALSRVERIAGSLNDFEGQETRINAAAELLKQLDVQRGAEQFLYR